MSRLLLFLTLFAFVATADEVSITRTTAFDWACADSSGSIISAHVRQDKAIESCVNRSQIGRAHV